MILVARLRMEDTLNIPVSDLARVSLAKLALVDCLAFVQVIALAEPFLLVIFVDLLVLVVVLRELATEAAAVAAVVVVVVVVVEVVVVEVVEVTCGLG